MALYFLLFSLSWFYRADQVQLGGCFWPGVACVVAFRWKQWLGSSIGSAGMKVQNGFFTHISDATAVITRSAGAWPDLSVSPPDFSTWLAWASSRDGSLKVVRPRASLTREPGENCKGSF